GVDGEKRAGKSCLIKKFAHDDFHKGEYKETLRAYVTTTHIQLENYTIKVEFLETGWDLRPNKNYYSYIDGAVLVYDISQSDNKTKVKKLLSDEDNSYINSKFPIMIIANKYDKYENKNNSLIEEKNYFGDEFLFNTTSYEEKTSASLNKILKDCISRLSNFKGKFEKSKTNDLSQLIPPSNQFKSMMEHATQLYLCEIPKIIYDRQQLEVLCDGIKGIKSFLSLVRTVFIREY
ncbi:14337_t:CDS:2, partial [Cetraspora pellucida]